MKNSHEDRRKINSELSVRGANQRVKEVINRHTPDDEKKHLKIDFYCECSSDYCRERISLTLSDYENLHDSQSRFVVAKGHESPSVEKVVKTRRGLQVVDKYAL